VLLSNCFYDDGHVQVWRGDARQLPIKDESVALVVTSPPYTVAFITTAMTTGFPGMTTGVG